MKARWETGVGITIGLLFGGFTLPPVGPIGPITANGKAAFSKIHQLEEAYVTTVLKKSDYKTLLSKTAEQEEWSWAFARARGKILHLESQRGKISQDAIDAIIRESSEPFRQADMIRKIKQDRQKYRNQLVRSLQPIPLLYQELDYRLRTRKLTKTKRTKIRTHMNRTKPLLAVLTLFDNEVAKEHPDFSRIGQYRRDIAAHRKSLKSLCLDLRTKNIARAR